MSISRSLLVDSDSVSTKLNSVRRFDDGNSGTTTTTTTTTITLSDASVLVLWTSTLFPPNTFLL